MCGILGLVGYDTQSLSEGDFIDSLDLIKHRGPDSGAFWNSSNVWFGHRRLAVVDLASRADQPMLADDFAIVFNGEIYNFREIRSELEVLGHSFKTASDTETLLRAWIQWGRNCLPRLEGMFAIAIWDRKKKQLTLARDRFGEKPLFVHYRNNSLAFASEMPPLIRLAEGKLTESTEAIGLYFLYSYIPAPYGAFDNVAQVEPGCWLEWTSNSEITHGRYYDFHSQLSIAANASQPTYASAVEQLRNRLTAAVRLRIETADVPVATFLSGGIDSSIITTLAANMTPGRLAAYSLGFPKDPEYDETDYARLVAGSLKNIEHRIVPATEESILDFSSKILETLGEPFADASILPTSLLCSQISEKVVLGGDAADELFAGYGVYPAIVQGMSLAPSIRAIFRLIGPHSNPAGIKNPVLRAAALFHYHLRDNPLDSYLSWRMYSTPNTLKALNIDCSANDTLRERISKNFSGSLRDAQTMDLIFNLPNDMLKKVDYASMVHGLEVRLPFLDTELVHWVLALPDHYKLLGGVRKRILREAFSEVLPAPILKRRKMGFLLPIRRWLTQGRLRAELEMLLSQQSRFDLVQARALIAEHAKGKADHSVLLWSLYIYLRWHARLSAWANHKSNSASFVQRITEAC